MNNSRSVYKNLLKIKHPQNTCFSNFSEGVNSEIKRLVRKKPSESKKSVHFSRNATNTLLFGSVLKESSPPKTIFPLFNHLKGDHFPVSSDDEIFSISIFEGGYKSLPSVRNILEQTMPPERQKILEAWKKKMILKLGEEGFEAYRQGLLDRGRNFHTCLELSLRKEELSEEQLVGVEDHWKSIKKVLPQISNIKLLESRVIHPALEYQGNIDCVGVYKDMPVVIEFKTSSRPKVTLASTYDDPLQVAAYIGALNYDSFYDLPNIKLSLLVIAYSTGLPAHVHVLKNEACLYYWKLWLQRLHQFRKLQQAESPVKE